MDKSYSEAEVRWYLALDALKSGKSIGNSLHSSTSNPPPREMLIEASRKGESDGLAPPSMPPHGIPTCVSNEGEHRMQQSSRERADRSSGADGFRKSGSSDTHMGQALSSVRDFSKELSENEHKFVRLVANLHHEDPTMHPEKLVKFARSELRAVGYHSPG